jgi:hypothetical protein
VADENDIVEILSIEERHDVANVCRQRDRFGEGAGLWTQTRGVATKTRRAPERRSGATRSHVAPL